MNEEQMILERDLILLVPFNERLDAKSKGAKPIYEGGVFAHWVVKSGTNVLPFKSWWAGESEGCPLDYISVPVETPSAHASSLLASEEQIDENPFFMDEQPFVMSEQPKEVVEKGVTLYSVLSTVKRSVASAFPQPIWIRVEVVNISGSNHVYLELSDYDDSGQEKSKARGMIWASNKGIITRWETETGMRLSAGVRVLVSAIPEFSEKFGLGLKIICIDSQFSVGEMELRLNEIRRRLAQEGVLDLNKRLSRPADFTNVAVIAPDAAAGLGDFMSQANVLIQNGICQFNVYHAYFQGDKVKATMLNAFHLIERDISNGVNYDAIVIIRGGGDKAGLNALNEYEIARSICVSSVPVLVGIGHERDTTILDEVSNIRYATPSLVVSGIIGVISGNAVKAKQDYEKIMKMSSGLVLSARMSINERLNQIRLFSLSKSASIKSECTSILSKGISNSKELLMTARNKCESENTRALVSAKALVIQARSKTQMLGHRIMPHHPSHSLAKGYAIVRCGNGSVITDSSNAASGDHISIELKTGTIDAVVMGTQSK